MRDMSKHNSSRRSFLRNITGSAAAMADVDPQAFANDAC